MSECTNLDMRDLLPDLARGTLTGPALVAVADHVATCVACRAELDLVRSAHAVLSATPAVDTSRIVAAIGRSKTVRRNAMTAMAEARRRRGWSIATPPRRVWLAAASIVAAVGISVVASNVARDPGTPAPAPVVAQSEQPTPPAPVTPEPVRPASPRPVGRVELMMAGGVSDLADAELESLLQVLEDVDTELDVEPAALLPVLEGDV